RLERQIEALAMRETVLLVGPQRDVAGIMAAADVVVISSKREALPNVLIEALALARPVVGTAVGGIPEIVRDNETGRLVAPGDTTALPGALPPAAPRLGAQGRARVADEFSALRSAAENAAVYREVVGTTRAGIS